MRRFSTSTLARKSKKSKAGVLCDIDGVLLRGREVLTGARESLKALYEQDIPTIFLTNQGLQSEEEKAQDLSQKLEIKVYIGLAGSCTCILKQLMTNEFLGTKCNTDLFSTLVKLYISYFLWFNMV